MSIDTYLFLNLHKYLFSTKLKAHSPSITYRNCWWC